MSEAKFTPGPWDIERKDSGFIRAIGPCSADEYAGSSWLEVSDDDAILISAAPDGLKAAENAYLTMLKITDYTIRLTEDFQFSLYLLRDFIAKATNQDPEDVQDNFQAKARGES